MELLALELERLWKNLLVGKWEHLLVGKWENLLVGLKIGGAMLVVISRTFQI